MDALNGDATIFHDLETFVATTRLDGVVCSADGSRVVTTVSTRNSDHTAYVSALWEIDPSGQAPAHRLTRADSGESSPVFSANDDLFFTSPRPAGAKVEENAKSDTSLWQLPALGGEARVVATHAGGISSVISASAAQASVLVAPLLLASRTPQEHAEMLASRRDAGIDAILHRGFPVRFWDHDLGPGQPQLFALTSDEHLRPISLDVGVSLVEHSPQLSPDGTFVLTTASVLEARGEQRGILLRIDVATGEHSRVVDELEHDVESVLISPDNAHAVVTMTTKTTPDSAARPLLWLIDLDTGTWTPLAHEWDRWPTPVAWHPDGTAVFALADDNGRGPVFRIDIASGDVVSLTHEDSTYSALTVPSASDGSVAYAVRSSPAFPSEVVRLDMVSGEATALRGPVDRPELPGTMSDVSTTTDDGHVVRGWLAAPHSGNGPAPLLVFIHGGPLSSWNAWTWRWNPWVLVAQGYAVLLPDPALSTGYGQEFIQRGWGAWGGAPYTDLMALTDEVTTRHDIDEDRTSALGGSFGGYMANWIAGHTDRFKAIVTHASLWALDGFGPTTDAAFYWQREMSEQMSLDNSPHRFVEQIVTPMLVIHGDKDYRVPIGEGLRLWYELLAKSGLPAAEDGSTVHQFLYFPHENHWVLKPQHAKIWYAVVMAFLSEHVLGTPPVAPPPELGLNP